MRIFCEIRYKLKMSTGVRKADQTHVRRNIFTMSAKIPAIQLTSLRYTSYFFTSKCIRFTHKKSTYVVHWHGVIGSNCALYIQ